MRPAGVQGLAPPLAFLSDPASMVVSVVLDSSLNGWRQVQSQLQYIYIYLSIYLFVCGWCYYGVMVPGWYLEYVVFLAALRIG